MELAVTAGWMKCIVKFGEERDEDSPVGPVIAPTDENRLPLELRDHVILTEDSDDDNCGKAGDNDDQRLEKVPPFTCYARM